MRTGLVLGLDGAGKTLLMRQLTAQLVHKQKSVLDRLATFLFSPCSNHFDRFKVDDGPVAIDANTQPTVGVEHWTLPLDGGRACTLREVGGQLLPMWPAYFESCHFWLFLVDASNATQLAAAAVELFAVLNMDEMRIKPKLLVLNQIDANFIIDDAVLQTYLCLDRLLSEPDSGPVQILKTSALTGENTEQILKWLGQAAGNNIGLSGRYRTVGRQNSTVEVRVHPIAD
ncbi:hypothetical protein BBO99_00009144 [Phytophthora kernoviae]|uniref:ADP-ribosylation factor-like protein 16 n=2 Tax=Phytophthora kernoviae TaxID=325452 RepID=A0A3R7GQU1_9STRA|nr:hypothetical protein G195_010711 [Phytophthora kernoviae 00238/432]KAG2502518.1 hypothetical protein JM16_009768 [Phytophthora kernoviae]RLM96111.1 hypothetical protein BBI17_009162 [Phytophthora kernoviae]RLN73987.1 hypothetical protein BBO99_00009144 [Phytophthora kernoviae]